jgi:soluble lytic murein transglycosylase-like protein
MPGTAGAYGLGNPFDAAHAIDAQAHLMRDLLRQFGSVPLALAAYNGGPAPVARCGCVPNIPGTQGYIARMLGLLGGAGQAGAGDTRLSVRPVARSPDYCQRAGLPIVEQQTDNTLVCARTLARARLQKLKAVMRRAP